MIALGILLDPAKIAPLPIAVPLLVAAVLVMLNRLIPRLVADGVALLTAVVVAVGCGWLAVQSAHQPIVSWLGNWQPRQGVAIGIALAVDPVGAAIATLAAVLMVAALVFSWRFFAAVENLYHVLMLTFLAGMVGFSFTGDLFNLFVFFELMGVAAYALTAYKIEEEGPLQGALNFAVTNSAGAFLMLFAIGMLYSRTGTLNMAQAGDALVRDGADPLVIVSFALLTVGLFVKAAMVPFHFWLPDAHAVAPTPFCVLLSGVMVELGLYAWARVYWTVYSGAIGIHFPGVRTVAMVAGAVTAVLGAILCFSQFQLKRMLAYSTMSHSGLALMGVALLIPGGLAGAGLYVLAHGAVKGALFICVGVLLHRHQTVDESVLHGRGIREIVNGTTFAVAGLALAGMPPFGTALGKQLMEETAVKAGFAWFIPVFVFASAISAGAVLRAAGRVFLGWGAVEEPALAEAGGPETSGERRRTPAVMIAPAILLVALALGLGLYHPVDHEAQIASDRFVDRGAYTAAVLKGQHVTVPSERGGQTGFNAKGLGLGLATTLAALVAAGAGMYHHRTPGRARYVFTRVGEPPLRALRAIHSGHVGDYIAWFSFGAAVFGMLFAAAVR